ncbi:MAG: hypothetical protein WA687_11585 [Solirubrobacterales bacterium]
MINDDVTDGSCDELVGTVAIVRLGRDDQRRPEPRRHFRDQVHEFVLGFDGVVKARQRDRLWRQLEFEVRASTSLLKLSRPARVLFAAAEATCEVYDGKATVAKREKRRGRPGELIVGMG